jgi:WD40 repeat protein
VEDALLLVTVAVVSTVLAVQKNAALVQTRQAERQARLREAEALLSQAHSSRFSRQVGQRFETLAALEKAAAIGRELEQPPEWFDRLRHEAIACLALPDWRPLQEWDGVPPGTHQWDCDARHRLYARKDLHGHISVRRLDTDAEIASLAGPPRDTSFDLSPDGRFLMVNGHGEDRIWDLGTSPPLPLGASKTETCGEVFHPDSRHKITTHEDGSVLLYDLASPHQAPQLLARFDDGRATCPTFAPGGDKLAVATSNGRAVHVLDVPGGRDRGRPWLPKASIWCVAWHPAGNLLAAACHDCRIYLWDTTRGQQAAVLEGCRNGGLRVAFTPDGEFVVSTGWEGKLRLWHWRTGEQVLKHPGVSNLRFSPEGRLIIQEGGRLQIAEVAVGREYRSLVQQSSPGKDAEYWRGAIHPDGRLLAVAMSDGVRLWDLETGAEVARIGPDLVRAVAFAPDSLMTNSSAGLFLWPIRPAPQPGTAWQVGPPRLLAGGATSEISCSNDGQVIAQARYNQGALVVRRDRPERPGRLGPQEDVRYVSMSPDGRFVATGSHGSGGGLKIWETEHGQVVKELRPGDLAHAVFSRDGRWLAVRGSEGARILTVGTWEEGPAGACDVAMAFSPDGNLLAAESGQGVIRLLDPANGREKARLEDPRQDVAGWLGFTPDGTRLVAVTEDGKAIHVWDLKRIRAELARLGLDWDATSYPERADPAPGPLEVRVVGGKVP